MKKLSRLAFAKGEGFSPACYIMCNEAVAPL